MSIYQIDVQKQRQSEYWTNVYHVNSVSLEAATEQAQLIAGIEANVHRQDVIITSYRVSDMSSDFFNTVPVNVPGAQPANAETLPLWDVVRIDMAVTGRRPGRKYLRLPVQEGESQNGVLTEATQDRINTDYCQALLSTVTTLSNEHGDAFTSAICNPNVAMRQLRRGSKRRLNPVI